MGIASLFRALQFASGVLLSFYTKIKEKFKLCAIERYKLDPLIPLRSREKAWRKTDVDQVYRSLSVHRPTRTKRMHPSRKKTNH